MQETISLKAPGIDEQMQAALVIEANQHTLVLFDPLGNKILQSRRTEHDVTTEFDSSEGLIPVRQLWAAVHLVRAENWSLSHSGWLLEQRSQGRSLRYNGRLWAEATNTLLVNESNGRATVRFPGQSLTIGITTVQAVQL